MAEWFKATVLKTVGGEEPSVGSNPTTAATRPCEMIYHGWLTDYSKRWENYISASLKMQIEPIRDVYLPNCVKAYAVNHIDYSE